MASSDPLRKLQIQKAQYDVAHQGDVAATDPMETPGGRFKVGQEYGLAGNALRDFTLTGKYTGEAELPAAPSGYQWTPERTLAPITGGPSDPANPLNAKRSGGAPSPTVAKEIFEADEGAQAGHNVIASLDRALELNGYTDSSGTYHKGSTRSGFGADFGASVGANLPDWVPFAGGDEATDTSTLELKNIVTANALESLKATFGAAPTEGERKILLEIQGSVDQPAAVREALFKRAKAAAERRIKFNEERARGLRSGEYFDEGYSPVTDSAAQTDIQSILDKYK